jgi:hypothetical protein
LSGADYVLGYATHHGDIDNVIVTGFSGQHADLPGKILGHRL